MSSGCEIMLCDHCKIFRLRGKRNEINPPTPAGISHGEAIFHTQSVFHKSRKGFISLKRNNLCPVDKGCFIPGAADGTRTRTVSLPGDFKSPVSTDSTTAAKITDIIYHRQGKVSSGQKKLPACAVVLRCRYSTVTTPPSPTVTVMPVLT